MKKIEIIGNALVITDLDTNAIVLDVPKSDFYYNATKLNIGKVSLYDTSSKNQFTSIEFINKLTDTVDKDNVVFTKTTFTDFARTNLGSANIGGSGGATDETTDQSNEDMNKSEPINEVTTVNNITTIDAKASKYSGLETGDVMGKHLYVFSGLKNTLDILAPTTLATIQAGANVVLVSPGTYEKDIAGNTWNASIYSTESFNPLTEDFAVSWKVESVDGTIREMGGFDDNPTQNNSYNSIEYAIYQVNNYFYSYVYEKGASKKIPNYTTFYHQVNDRQGVACIDQIIYYFVIRNGILTIIHKSTTKATNPLFFKAAFNRGDGSSGESTLGDVQFHTATKTDSFNVKVDGLAGEVVTEEHRKILAENCGISLLTGATYSNLEHTRLDIDKFKTSGTPYPVNLTHSYIGVLDSVTKEITY